MGCSRIGGAAQPSAAPRSMCMRPHGLARVGQAVGVLWELGEGRVNSIATVDSFAKA
jgi:hypothetical protein